MAGSNKTFFTKAGGKLDQAHRPEVFPLLSYSGDSVGRKKCLDEGLGLPTDQSPLLWGPFPHPACERTCYLFSDSLQLGSSLWRWTHHHLLLLPK